MTVPRIVHNHSCIHDSTHNQIKLIILDFFCTHLIMTFTTLDKCYAMFYDPVRDTEQLERLTAKLMTVFYTKPYPEERYLTARQKVLNNIAVRLFNSPVCRPHSLLELWALDEAYERFSRGIRIDE